jgi:SAM-dependent methyltransferase
LGTKGNGYQGHHHLIDSMPDILDQRYLELEQYKDASQLNARIQLHQRFSTNTYGWFKWVFNHFILPDDAFILEIGCGPGTLWLENIERISAGWSVILSDFSPGMLRESRSNLKGYPISFTYEASNALAIPFQEETFHAVIANHMLYHLPDLHKALGEINRVLKPGGCLYATTNGENHLKKLSEIMDRFINFGGKRYSPTFSTGGFTLDNGTRQLSPWFKQINIHQYEDGLIVNEAGPLLEYILSMIPQEDIPDELSFIADLSSYVNQLISQEGSIHIHKSIGMFLCEK